MDANLRLRANRCTFGMPGQRSPYRSHAEIILFSVRYASHRRLGCLRAIQQGVAAEGVPFRPR